MKNSFFLFLSILLLFTQHACEKPVLDNPYGDDIIPQITISNDTPYGSVIDTSEITISWTPNIYAFEFSYMLEPVDTSWSGWNEDTTAYYSSLDEGDYSFYIKSRYNDTVEIKSLDTLAFLVNAISGPGLRIYPLNRSESIISHFGVSPF